MSMTAPLRIPSTREARRKARHRARVYDLLAYVAAALAILFAAAFAVDLISTGGGAFAENMVSMAVLALVLNTRAMVNRVMSGGEEL